MGVLAEGHIGDVEQPAGAQVIWVCAEGRCVLFEGGPRAFWQSVDSLALDGQQTRGDGVVEQAVFLLAEAQVGNAQPVADSSSKSGGQVLCL